MKSCHPLRGWRLWQPVGGRLCRKVVFAGAQGAEEKVLKIDRLLAGGFLGLTVLRTEGCCIAYGDEYIVSVTGYTFLYQIA